MSYSQANPEEADIALLHQIAKGDTEAFSRLYDRFSNLIFSISVGILKSATEAEDILQEVSLKIWKNAHHFDYHQGKVASWVAVLTRNKAIDRLRASQRNRDFIENAAEKFADTDTFSPTSEETIVGKETASFVRSALEKLPPKYQQPLKMSFFGGLTQSEIAQLLDQPLGTIKARIRRGMFLLRDSLKAYL